MIKKATYLFILIVISTSCKSTKKATSSSIVSMSSKKIVKSHYETKFDKSTITANIKARYSDKNRSQVVSIKLRMQKDSVIWMSGRFLGIPMAKIIITPTKVIFYEKLGKTFFEGDFKLLSDFLGTEVDFEIVQNLLVGQAILDLKTQKFNVEIEGDSYKLEPKKQEELFDLLFWMSPKNFRIKKQEVRQPKLQKKMTVSYEYQNVVNEVFPKKIDIIAVDKVDRVFIGLEYKSVEFERRVSFPFKIPVGYKEIQLNE